jgi:uncharacterized integral membrane protein
MTQRGQSHTPTRTRRRLAPRMVTGLALGVLAVVFVVENMQRVDVRILVPVVTMPLWAALTAVLFVGIVVGLLFTRTRR